MAVNAQIYGVALNRERLKQSKKYYLTMRITPSPSLPVMQKYYLFILYVAISLLIGKDFHPFSQFPMYNSFPNYSYVFYLTNERGNIVPFRKSFSLGKGAGTVAHKFNAFFEYHNYKTGYGEEDSTQLKQAGKELMDMLLQGENTGKFDFDTLRLFRRYYRLEQDTITYRDNLMYEQAIKP